MRLWIVAIALLMQSPSVLPQTINVSGLVTDHAGASLPGVIISFKAKHIEKKVLAAADGRYELALAAGTYEVIGKLQGCKDFRLKKWNTESATRNTLNLSLLCRPTPIY
jgi:hypothetical protein